MRSSLSDPDSPSTLNSQGVTVSPILAERASPPAGHYAVSSERGRSNDLPTMALGDLRELPLVYRPDRAVHQLLE